MGNDGDGILTPEKWQELKAEWTHDYGLRRLENRGVHYEDEPDRTLDHAAGGEGQENKREVSPADLTERTGPASQPPGQRQARRHGISM